MLDLFADTYGIGNAKMWYHRWRIFFLACAELFCFGCCNEWLVCHMLLKPKTVK